jgi:hypothetical protein
MDDKDLRNSMLEGNTYAIQGRFYDVSFKIKRSLGVHMHELIVKVKPGSEDRLDKEVPVGSIALFEEFDDAFNAMLLTANIVRAFHFNDFKTEEK